MAAAAGGVGPTAGRVTGTAGRGAARRTGASALPAPKRRLLRVPATSASASGPAHQGLVLRPHRRKDGVVGRANAADGVAGRPPEVDDMVVGRAEAVEEGVDGRPPEEVLAGGHCRAVAVEIGAEPVPNVVLAFLTGPALGLSKADIVAPAPRRSGGAAAGPCGGPRELGWRIRRREGVGGGGSSRRRRGGGRERGRRRSGRGCGGVGERAVGRGTPGPGWTLGAFRRG